MVGSKNIKQKEKISENPDEDNNIHYIPFGKSRSQEQPDHMRQNRFAGYDGDLKMLESKGYRITSTSEVLPTTTRDAETFTQEDLDTARDRRNNNQRQYEHHSKQGYDSIWY